MTLTVLDWLKGELRAFYETITSPIRDFQDWLEENIVNKLVESVLKSMEELEPEAAAAIRDNLDKLLEIPDLPKQYREFIIKAKEPRKPVWFIPLIAAGAAILGGLISSFGGGFFEGVRQEGNKLCPNTLLPPADLISLYRRGKISTDTYTDEMARHGFSDTRREWLETATEYVPGVSDLIRWTVRDVFRDDIVQRYGYDTDYDKIIDDLQIWLNALGVKNEVMRNYWRAHWQLPPVTLGYEMLHRRKIEIEDLRTLLRINDIAPYWIDKIIEVSYSPYTRVDARRMYELGVLNEKELYDAYRDIGYDDQHARNLVEWTKRYSTSSERELTKTQIIDAYVKNKITPYEARSLLMGIGYSFESAELILALEDYDIEKKRTDELIDLHKDEVLHGIETVEQFKTQMKQLGLSQREIDRLVDEIAVSLRKRRAHPSKEDLVRWYKKKIIGLDEFKEEMAIIGYTAKDIDRYLAEM